ncbi:glutathione S-transferase [Oceaniserpentilla sp. 4NH20-0058]|uniref:glutathione S-transferase n=1 Tax=Oceaniserpentilla sp. 4NH20-0058 TaxID=3127660 RepID=UPI003103A9D3
MITLHHLNNSRSQRIIWLLEEIGIDYKIEFYERHPVTIRAPQALKDVHPLGKSPVISDDQTGITLAESGAIIEYLVHNYAPQLKPNSDSPMYWQYQYWMHFSEGSLMPPMLISLVFTQLQKAPMPFFIKPVAKMLSEKTMANFVSPNIKALLGFIENHLSQNTWFCGNELSGADFQMSFPLEAAVARGIINESLPHTLKYVKTFQARKAYQAGLEKGGEYDYA